MSLYPAEVVSYDAPRRRVRIKVIGLTDGDKLLPEAELMYSMGDKSPHTEIEICAGDLVWVDFIGGDHRYPIITGYRNAETNNAVGWRKWHHANIEISADGECVIKCKKFSLQSTTNEFKGTSTFQDQSTFQSQTMLDGGMSTTKSAPVLSHGGIKVHNGDVQTDTVSLNNHLHQDSLGGTTGKPIGNGG